MTSGPALPWPALGARSPEGLATFAQDLAVLLQHHFRDKGDGSQPEAAGSLPPHLRALANGAATALWDRPEWTDLAGRPTLADALQHLVSSNVAEKVGDRLAHCRQPLREAAGDERGTTLSLQLQVGCV